VLTPSFGHVIAQKTLHFLLVPLLKLTYVVGSTRLLGRRAAFCLIVFLFSLLKAEDENISSFLTHPSPLGSGLHFCHGHNPDPGPFLVAFFLQVTLLADFFLPLYVRCPFATSLFFAFLGLNVLFLTVFSRYGCVQMCKFRYCRQTTSLAAAARPAHLRSA